MFDNVVTKNKIEYGIIHGNNNLFFIKVGNGGDIYGYNNKYLKMSHQMHDEFDCSVLVSSNPVELNAKNSIMLDFDFIKENFKNIIEVNAFGHSNGGQMLISYAYMYPKIKNVLAVNVPLIVNLHKTKEGIKNFVGNKMHMVYGEKDPSFRYIEVLKSSLSPKFSYSTIKNANHHFENMLEEFILLPKQFLY